MGKKRSSVDAQPITAADGPISCLKAKRKRKDAAPRDVPPQRSSSYRGVTRHRWTGRFEAHLWDKDCWNETQSKKGKQVYLGAYDDEEAAARAYDLAAVKYWGQETILNCPISTYQEELKEMEGQSREEYIGSLRRKSSGFSRGVSKYRGVARHHHNGRWEARIGRVFGNKYLYLGTYATQEEAAMAYDMAAIEYRGLNAVTNFDLSRYVNLIQHDPNSDGRVDCVETPSFKSNPIVFHNYPPKFEEATERSSSTTTTEEYILSPPFRLPSSRCSFPDDIQTFFECRDGEDFITDDDTIFGGLGSLPSVDLQFELD